MEADGSWWGPWSSKPAWGVKSVPGVFDSHTLPPRPLRVFTAGAISGAGRTSGLQPDLGTEHFMRGRTITMLTLLVALGATLTGCSGIQQAITPKPKVNKVTIEATVAVPAASVDGKLVAGAPKTLPLWPGAKVLRSKATKMPGGTTWTATLSTGDPYIDVVNGVGVGFQQAQWQVAAQDMTSGDASGTLLTVSDGQVDGLVTVSNLPKKKIVQIEYTITPQQ